MIMGTRDRVANNLNCYLESKAPHYVPGGGCFSICNFSLMTLYQEHLEIRNWWTTSNDNYPLVRYMGCTMYLYREENLDYLFYYNRQPPMNASLTTYQSTQPLAMMLNKHTVKVQCKKTSKSRKPYKRINIKPPTQLQNKWYFSYDIANTPLLQTMTTATSFDRMFLNSSSISNTIGITTLDTNTFLNHMFQRTTSPYQPRPNTTLFKTKNGAEQINNIQIGSLIILGEVEDLTDGTELQHVQKAYEQIPNITNPTEFQKQFYTAKMKHEYWGNVFKPSTFSGDERMIESNKPIDELIKEYTTPQTTLKTGFTFKTTKTAELRYNPFADKGQGNMAYLLKIDSGLHATEWGPPTDKDVIATDLPLHTLLWGYLDYQRRCKEYRNIDTTCILVIQCKYVQPNNFKFIVPLDPTFLEGTSPYRPQFEITPSDRQYWHPKVAMQVQTVNNICLCGPATVKLPPQISCESHVRYKFRFKLGGQPAPMSVLTKPDEQPKYPIPNNLLQTPSLQSPTIPFTQLLWNFDERRHQITKKATERITKDRPIETTILSITDPGSLCPTYKETEKTQETTSSEEEEASLETQLLHQRRRQRQLRHKINYLLNRLTNLE